jgi:hypothetical protein
MERKCRFKPIFSESVPLDSTQCHIGCKIGVQEVAGSNPVTPTIESSGSQNFCDPLFFALRPIYALLLYLYNQNSRKIILPSDLNAAIIADVNIALAED